MRRKWILVVGMICIFFTGVFCPGNAAASDQQDIKWHTYDEAIQLGRKEGKKILLHFWAEWCAYCTRMRNETFKDASVISYLNQNYISVKIDFDQQRTIAGRYKVRGLPDTYFLTAEGNRISNLPGYIKAELMIGILKYLHTESYKKMSFDRFLKDG